MEETGTDSTCLPGPALPHGVCAHPNGPGTKERLGPVLPDELNSYLRQTIGNLWIAVVAGEQHPFLRHAIDVGGVDQLADGHSKLVDAGVIGKNINDV